MPTAQFGPPATPGYLFPETPAYNLFQRDL
jgi:hypothetical protein